MATAALTSVDVQSMPPSPSSSSSPQRGEPKPHRTGWFFPHSIWPGILAAAFYFTVSVLLTFFNKACFSFYKFDESLVLTFGQIVGTILFLRSFHQFGLVTLPPFRFEIMRKMIWLTIAQLGMIVTGFIGMQLTTLPMYEHNLAFFFNLSRSSSISHHVDSGCRLIGLVSACFLSFISFCGCCS